MDAEAGAQVGLGQVGLGGDAEADGVGAAGLVGRCFGTGDPLMAAYHDLEWGRPVVGEAAHLERLALEAFQAGLSWRVVLSKRAAFRELFEGFEPDVVAAFGPEDVERLVSDARIVRNRAKVEAVIAGARATVALHEAGGTLAEVLARHRPPPAPPRTSWEDLPTSTPESAALAVELKRLGFRFVGPTTTYATMQAIGLVNDHLAGCPARASTGRDGVPAVIGTTRSAITP